MIDWKIGCSGFHYKEWKNVFYPEKLAAAKWLSYYSEHFKTLESNVTFYRMPTEKTLDKWYANTPDNFIFSVKAPRLITHYKKFNAVKDDLDIFYSLIKKSLNDKLGCILFQCPPSLVYSQEALQRIIQSLDRNFINVVEFRHQSWWHQAVYDELKKNNISFCSISYPKLDDNVIATSETIYFRFHGIPRLYYSAYTHEYMRNIVSQIKKIRGIKRVFLYFNNTADLAAIQNARYIQELLEADSSKL